MLRSLAVFLLVFALGVLAVGFTFSASTRVRVANDSRNASKAWTGADTAHWIG